jgi:hypothetical protein
MEKKLPKPLADPDREANIEAARAAGMDEDAIAAMIDGVVMIKPPDEGQGGRTMARFDEEVQRDPGALAEAQEQARQAYEDKIAWAPKGEIITLTAEEWLGFNVASRDG